MLRIHDCLLPAAALLLAACAADEEPVAAPARPPAVAEATPPPEPRPAGLVAEGARWEVVTQGYVYTDSPAATDTDAVYFSAPVQNRLYRLEADGKISVFDSDTEMTMGLFRGPDDRIYACRNRGAQITVYTDAGDRQTLLEGEMTPLPNNPDAPGEFCNDIVVNARGDLWFTDRVNRRVMHVAPNGEAKIAAEGFRPNGIALSADEKILAVTDSNAPRLVAFAIGEDGALTLIPDFFDPVRTVERLGDEEIAEGRPGTDGMTVDEAGRFYVSSFYGIQVYDKDGDYVGVIEKPVGFVSNLSFAGADRKTLYASGLNGLFRLRMQVRGAR